MPNLGENSLRRLDTIMLIFILLVTIGLVSCTPIEPLTPVLRHKTLEHGLDSPLEFALQAWFANKGGIDTSGPLKKITAKSIFIAPENKISCPKGYTMTIERQCEPEIVKINENLQKAFFLRRLNSLYAKQDSNKKKPESSVPTGPFHIIIPINPVQQPVIPVSDKPIRVEIPVTALVTVETTSQPITATPEPINETLDPVAAIFYKVANDTRPKEQTDNNETTVLSTNISTTTPKTNITETEPFKQIDVKHPVEDEINETSGILSYKEPSVPVKILNFSNILEQNKINDNKPVENIKKDDLEELLHTSTAATFTMLPTKSPIVATTKRETIFYKPEFTEHSTITLNEEHTEISTIQNETKLDASSFIDTVTPLDLHTFVESSPRPSKSRDGIHAPGSFEDETIYADDETPPELDSEEYDESQTDFADNEDELLKAGEAGMMITPANYYELMRSKKHDENQNEHQNSTDLKPQPTLIALDEITTILTTSTDGDTESSTAIIDEETKTEAVEPTSETTEIPSTIITAESSAEDTITETTDQPISNLDLVKSTVSANVVTNSSLETYTVATTTTSKPTEQNTVDESKDSFRAEQKPRAEQSTVDESKDFSTTEQKTGTEQNTVDKSKNFSGTGQKPGAEQGTVDESKDFSTVEQKPATERSIIVELKDFSRTEQSIIDESKDSFRTEQKPGNEQSTVDASKDFSTTEQKPATEQSTVDESNNFSKTEQKPGTEQSTIDVPKDSSRTEQKPGTEQTTLDESQDSIRTEKPETDQEVTLTTQVTSDMLNNYSQKYSTIPPTKEPDYSLTSSDLSDIAKTEFPQILDFINQQTLNQRRRKPVVTINDEPINFRDDSDIPIEFKEQLSYSNRPIISDPKRLANQPNNNDEALNNLFPDQPSKFNMKFPSDEINSINNQDEYKKQLSFLESLSHENYFNPQTSTKSSVPSRQKILDHWSLPFLRLRIDRQNPQRADDIRQRQMEQKPMIFRFRTRDPFVRDVSYLPGSKSGVENDKSESNSEPQQKGYRLNSRFADQSNSRFNYNKERSLHDINRIRTQQLSQPEIGG